MSKTFDGHFMPHAPIRKFEMANMSSKHWGEKGSSCTLQKP